MDTDGVAKAAFHLLLEQCIESGIETIVLVVSPGSENVYRRYLAPIPLVERGAYNNRSLNQSERLQELSKRVRFCVQNEPAGFGHAVHCAGCQLEEESFAVLLGDHIHLTRNPRSCLSQTLDMFAKNGRSVFAVHYVEEEVIGRFGIIGGSRILSNLFAVERIVEKPSVDLARATLRAENGKYLAHFGIYVFTPAILGILGEMVVARRDDEVQLTAAQSRLIENESCLAFVPDGKSYDFGVPEGLIETQRALTEFGQGRQPASGPE